MWYGFVNGQGYFTSLGGSAELKRLPPHCVQLTEAQYTQLKADLTALWYYNGQVQAVDQAVVAAKAKASRIRALEAYRNARIADGMTYTFPDGNAGTVPMHLVQGILNITGLGSAANAMVSKSITTSQDFMDAEGAQHTMTPDQIVTMSLAAQSRVSAIYKNSWTHAAAIEQLTDPATIEGYDFTTGWPT